MSPVSDIVRRRLRFRAHTAETLAFLLSSLWNHSDGGHDTLSGYLAALDSHVRAGGGCMGELHCKQHGSDTKDAHGRKSSSEKTASPSLEVCHINKSARRTWPCLSRTAVTSSQSVRARERVCLCVRVRTCVCVCARASSALRGRRRSHEKQWRMYAISSLMRNTSLFISQSNVALG